jgi:predicted ATP-dependent serine protease
LRFSANSEVDRLNGLIAEISPPGKRFVNLSEFLSEQYDFSWLVGGLLARGALAMLVADTGLGKSTLMAQLTLCLVHARSFLGSRIQEPARVLMIQAEGARGAFQGRMNSATRALGLTERDAWDKWFIQAHDFDDFRIGGPGLEAIVKDSKPDLVILDTLGYFAKFNENDAVEWKQRVAIPLRRLSNDVGTSFILVHHPPKETEVNKGNRDARGTSAMRADCDHFWRLDQVKGQPSLRELVVMKNRYGIAMTVELAFDAQNAIFRQTDGGPEPAPVKTKAKQEDLALDEGPRRYVDEEN